MITSSQIIKLVEEYYNTFNISGKDVIVFVNPTSNDFPKICKSGRNEVRFIRDENVKNVYVWDAYLAIHDEMRKALKLDRDIFRPAKITGIYNGTAQIDGNKLINISGYYFRGM